MDPALATRIEESDKESADLDFKSGFDPASAQDWCELVKDIVAMANSSGGLIIFGVNDDGTAANRDLKAVLAVDPAKIADKIQKYTDQHLDACSVSPASRRGAHVAALRVASAYLPIVFTNPGTYDVGAGKQRTAFAKGTVYFRHGAKSEPGTTDDLRGALNKELDRVRGSWLDGITKVVTAPRGATISVLPGEVRLTGAQNATGVRLVNDDTAPAFKAYRTDLLYPYRQKELVTRVKALLGDHNVTPHDVHCVRKAHGVDGEPNFFYKPQFSSPQYSEAFAEWIVNQYRANDQFFLNAREALKKHEPA